MILLAGVHKFLAPGAWAVYVVDWLEVAFGVALLVDRYTAFAAAVAAVSLTAPVGYLAVVWGLSGRFGDVLARDVGLAALAWALLVDALRAVERCG